MSQINLVPEVQERKQKLAKINSTVVSIAVICVIVVSAILIILSGIILANKASLNNVNDEISATKTEIAKYAELEKTVLSLENGLASAKKILDGQNAWTKLLPHLEAATPNDVKYVKMTLEPNKITANLEGKDINSLARFVESYKNYKLVVFSGSGTWGTNVEISIDGGTASVIPVKSDGTWNYATKIDPSKDHTVTVKNGEKTSTLTYTSKDQKITSEDGSVQTKISNLFKSVEVSQYNKNGTITFEAKIIYDGALLW